MDRQTYLKRFSLAVRWMLPGPEADEVLEDYDEMLFQPLREDKGSLIQELGEPVKAAKLLLDPKAYYRWLAVFGVAVLCLLLPEFLLLRTNFSHSPAGLICALFLLGTAVSLIWFRPRGKKSRRSPIPKSLLLLLLGLLVIVAAAGAIMVILFRQSWSVIPPALYGKIAHGTLMLAGTAAAAFGLLGLVKARLSNRRWCSLYVMGLTGLAECVLVLALLVSPTLDALSFAELISYSSNLIIIGIAGLVGVGVSLC